MYIKFADDGTTEDREVFVPTEEWQVVKPGQAVPKGLHIKYDLQTGVYMAKLLDREEEDSHQPPHQAPPSTSLLNGKY